MKIPIKRELQQMASNHLLDIDFKNFMKLYKEYTKEPYLFLVNKATFIIRQSITIQEELIIKMSITEKIKAINSKMEQNETV